MKVAIYQLKSAVGCNLNDDMAYLAYIVLPNGEYWGVRFNGATEEIARTKAIATWQHEQEKWKALEPEKIGTQLRIRLPSDDDPWQEAAADKQYKFASAKKFGDAHNDLAKQHHLAGLVWMIHKDTREKKRVKLTEITMYEKQGYFRGGPRSK